MLDLPGLPLSVLEDMRRRGIGCGVMLDAMDPKVDGLFLGNGQNSINFFKLDSGLWAACEFGCGDVEFSPKDFPEIPSEFPVERVPEVAAKLFELMKDGRVPQPVSFMEKIEGYEAG